MEIVCRSKTMHQSEGCTSDQQNSSHYLWHPYQNSVVMTAATYFPAVNSCDGDNAHHVRFQNPLDDLRPQGSQVNSPFPLFPYPAPSSYNITSTPQSPENSANNKEKRYRCLACKSKRDNRSCPHKRTDTRTSTADLGYWSNRLIWFHGLYHPCRFPADSASLMVYFKDRWCSNVSVFNNIDLEPCSRLKNTELPKGGNVVPTMLQVRQLNQIVAGGVWGISLWNAEKQSRTPAERLFWSLIQLCTGYLSLIHHLPTTNVLTSACLQREALECMTLRYISLIVQQLDVCYVSILQWSQQLERPREFSIAPALVLYGFETMHLLFQSMRDTNWNLTAQLDANSLGALAMQLNEWVGRSMMQIEEIYLRLSNHYPQGCRMKPIPAMVQFARDLNTKSFPKYSVIRINPGFDGPECQMSITDIMCQRHHSHLTFNGDQMPFTSYLIANDNKIHAYGDTNLKIPTNDQPIEPKHLEDARSDDLDFAIVYTDGWIDRLRSDVFMQRVNHPSKTRNQTRTVKNS